MRQLLITGGTVINGSVTARPGKKDILIEGDRISRIAPTIAAPDAQRIDANGLIVAPGFIDSHSHSDIFALIDSSAQGRVFDGVTTEINGTCGFSLFPLSERMKAQRADALRMKGVEIDWDDAEGYLDHVARAGSAINRGFLVGHGALRGAVMGYLANPPTTRQQQRMERLLDEALEQGAFGLSSGLCYPPGCFGRRTEIMRLCRRLARTGRPYCTHIRNEGRKLLESVEEAIWATRQGGGCRCTLAMSKLTAG